MRTSRLVSISDVESSPVPAHLLPNFEGSHFIDPAWCGEIALGEPKTCQLGLRCLYPLIEDELDPDDMPEAFTNEPGPALFTLDSVMGTVWG